jgi:NarL family two-component system sensor histidine kinase LiaS
MQRFLRSFRQLRWKLTLSYALTSVAAFLLVAILIPGSFLFWLGTHTPDFILSNLQPQAAQGVPYLAKASTDPEPLATWLQITAATANPGGDPYHLHPIFLTVTDTQGKILASTGSHALIAGTSILPQLSQQSRANLNAVLNDPHGKTSEIAQETNNILMAIVPMVGSSGHVQAALVLKVDQPHTQILFSYFFYIIFFGGTAAFILTTLIGTIFGYLIARGLTRRLKRLSAVADKWSRGDFSAPAVDASQDELGQMARQLNHMAEQLHNLLETRQQLATLEERNRLARDLHDSVKQQVFAISMQIAATRVLLTRDVEAASERLNKAETLVKQAQQELTSLIRELRPVALEGKGLVAALRELVPQWSQQSDIVANLRVEGAQTLPVMVEEALFRVAQEALSNIARHSKASLVQITLSMTGETVTLSVHDNGQGFDPAHLERRGVGLHSMQERMKALGGDLKLESAPDQGTLVVAHCTRLGTDSSEKAGMQGATTL